MIALECLQPGDRLPSEAELAARLGVGRSTLREAVRVLGHIGVLRARQGSGTFVASVRSASELEQRLTRARVAEVFEVRHALEGLIARLASQRRTPEQVRRMREALEQCRQHADNGDLAAFVKADMQFHQVAAEATENSVLVELYGALRRSFEQASVTIADLVELQRANDLHADLLEAIARGESRAAAAATRRHLNDTERLFRSALHP